ncbi:MAG: hypothetical protein ACXWJM_15150 [Ramlibacter sp.]
MSSKLPIAFIAAAAFLAAPATAQTVYRCGDTYVQKPCPGGKAVDVDDSRSASQRTDTLDATKRTAQAADAMQKERLAEEAKAAQALLPPEKPEAVAQKDGPTVVRAPAVRKKANPKPKAPKSGSKKHEKKATS